ncbi:hypothetical protein [Pseudomonas sp. Irchel 3E20]|uniref:hypothetical protein n=1 Tax=Pseudomonas sp. Irchel 3E20 TaxID=2008983 RepID=UPI000BA35AA1|nr:hypothetical protein [Pseudomonas sp. Irchel 3E20]
MTNIELNVFIETELNLLARRIIDKKNVSDEIAHAKIGFYLSLRRVLNSKETPADIGFLDAINDTLQALGIIEKNRTFLANTKELIK